MTSDDLLGTAVPYPQRYAPELLRPIARAAGRAPLGLEDTALPFVGVDRWTAYELSWLDVRGKPQVAIGELVMPCTSPHLVESKSLKLYLNSLNQEPFADAAAVAKVLRRDLGAACGAAVAVDLYRLDDYGARGVGTFAGQCLDDLPIACRAYSPAPELLTVDRQAGAMTEVLYSHLFKSNCPVTGQPDWASVQIGYRGPPIDRAGLLAYLVSFREHQGFHEHCVERIFVDIQRRCVPTALTVTARYTRRGGLDINPLRSTGAQPHAWLRLARQ